MQSLELHCVNLSTLLELRQLAECLPQLTSLTISEDGNPVTTHPLFSPLLLSLLPLTRMNGVEPTAAEQSRAQCLFAPLHALTSSSEKSIHVYTVEAHAYIHTVMLALFVHRLAVKTESLHQSLVSWWHLPLSTHSETSSTHRPASGVPSSLSMLSLPTGGRESLRKCGHPS